MTTEEAPSTYGLPDGVLGGARCRACGCTETHVKDSRPVDSGAYIRRRRACAACDQRWTTYELDAHCFEFLDAHVLWQRFATLDEIQRNLIHELIDQFAGTGPAGGAAPSGQLKPEYVPSINSKKLAPAGDVASPVGAPFQGRKLR